MADTNATLTTPPKAPEPIPGSEGDLLNQANLIQEQETQRYQSGLDTLQTAFNSSQSELSQLLDGNLLYSRAADAVGAQGKSALSSLRTSLGARGISPNSGAANGTLSRLITSQQGQLIGAKRDIALANQEQRYKNAAVNFSNAANVASYINSPVSGVRYEAGQNIFEGNIAREGIASAERSNRYAAKKQKQGAIGGGALSLLGKI